MRYLHIVCFSRGQVVVCDVCACVCLCAWVDMCVCVVPHDYARTNAEARIQSPNR